jgi:hypothetical protein
MRSIKWWHPPFARGLGRWYAAISQQGYSLFRYSPSGFLCGVACGDWVAADAAGQVTELQDVMESLMKRRVKTGEGAVVCPHADATELLEQWPSLAAWLTDPTFEDGAPRPAGWMGLSAEGGLFTVLLKDAGERSQLRVQAPSLSRLLDLVEHSLTDPLAPWRHDSGAFQARAGKRKN